MQIEAKKPGYDKGNDHAGKEEIQEPME